MMDIVAHDLVVSAFEARFGRRQFVSRHEAAEFWAPCSLASIDRWIREGRLKTVKGPGGVKIPKASVIQMAEV
jgi:hypothetical protein